LRTELTDRASRTSFTSSDPSLSVGTSNLLKYL
jgi:hypothetical protein